MKIIFLDIDGVLNGYNKRSYYIWKIFDFFKLNDFFHRIYDVFGTRIFKIFLLKILVSKTNAKIVMSSSWRGQWFTPFDKCNDRIKSLKRKFKFFNLDVIDILFLNIDFFVPFHIYLVFLYIIPLDLLPFYIYIMIVLFIC